MPTIDVVSQENKKVGTVTLAESVFSVKVNFPLVHQVIKAQLADRRQGTAKTKTKGEVRGGGKKPFKQKGTGNARQGSSRSPLMPGGGVIFGPKPRDYSYSLPKQLKKAGLRSALSYLHKEGRFFVVKDMTSKEGKAKELSQRLKDFGVNKALLVDQAGDVNFTRASRNLKNYRYTKVDGLNVFDLLRYDAAVVTESSLEKIFARCGERE